MVLFSVSTAPKHFNQPELNPNLSKNQKKKLKKKAKAKQALLDKQIKDLEELEEKETRVAMESLNITPGMYSYCIIIGYRLINNYYFWM